MVQKNGMITYKPMRDSFSDIRYVHRTILDNSLVSMVLVRKRHIIQANKKLAEMFRYDSPDDMTGNLTRIFYRSNEDFEEISKTVYSALADGKEARYELLAKRKDGSEFWCLLSGKSVNPDEMNNADSVWIFQDIDEMKRQKEELKKSKELFAAIISNMADALLVVDNYKKIVSCNSAFLSMFGFTEEEFDDKNIYDIFDGEIIKLIDDVFLDGNINKKGIYISEIKIKGNGTGKAVATPMYINSAKNRLPSSDYANDAFVGAVITVRDITKEKEIDMMKTDFITTASHELRTPLTSIIGFANIIRKKFKESLSSLLNAEDKKTKKVAEQIESNLDIIISEGERLTSLINDILDIAKMEAGKIEWKDENFTLHYAIGRAIAATNFLFKEKGLNIITDIDNNLPAIFGDKDRFIQVIINLISNAVKFTDKGSIIIRGKLDKGFILVSVIDNGAGIGRKNIDKIFEKFKQAGDMLTNKPEGTGLGLPICKQIVEHYGGSIWVESEEGKGSTFYFTVPFNSQRR